jgi:hypothetical protein
MSAGARATHQNISYPSSFEVSIALYLRPFDRPVHPKHDSKIAMLGLRLPLRPIRKRIFPSFLLCDWPPSNGGRRIVTTKTTDDSLVDCSRAPSDFPTSSAAVYREVVTEEQADVLAQELTAKLRRYVAHLMLSSGSSFVVLLIPSSFPYFSQPSV